MCKGCLSPKFWFTVIWNLNHYKSYEITASSSQLQKLVKITSSVYDVFHDNKFNLWLRLKVRCGLMGEGGPFAFAWILFIILIKYPPQTLRDISLGRRVKLKFAPNLKLSPLKETFIHVISASLSVCPRPVSLPSL
jgi:hypothetical protein